MIETLALTSTKNAVWMGEECKLKASVECVSRSLDAISYNGILTATKRKEISDQIKEGLRYSFRNRDVCELRKWNALDKRFESLQKRALLKKIQNAGL